VDGECGYPRAQNREYQTLLDQDEQERLAMISDGYPFDVELHIKVEVMTLSE
jgi:hypothetical protein